MICCVVHVGKMHERKWGNVSLWCGDGHVLCVCLIRSVSWLEIVWFVNMKLEVF